MTSMANATDYERYSLFHQTLNRKVQEDKSATRGDNTQHEYLRMQRSQANLATDRILMASVFITLKKAIR